MSQAADMIADISTPQLVNGVAPVAGTVRRAATGTAEVWKIPTEWLGKIVDFKFYDSALTTRAYIRFGTSASVLVDATTVSDVDGATKAITTNATPKEPHIELEAGQEKSERIDKRWTHLAHLESATGGYIMATLRVGEIGAGG